MYSKRYKYFPDVKLDSTVMHAPELVWGIYQPAKGLVPQSIPGQDSVVMGTINFISEESS